MHAWQPSASLKNLRTRARILKEIRDFFSERYVMEVETPLLCHTSVTDPFIQSISALLETSSEKKQRYYLQTSPEYSMKRLLANGIGPIYQICKAFRQEEIGRFHNPEFTMLEWYRPGFTHHELMNEVDSLLQATLKTTQADKKTYAELFQSHLAIDPHLASLEELLACLTKNAILFEGEITDRDTCLQLLMSECIEPVIGQDKPCFVYDFPASQAALAKIIAGKAARFEVYFQGIELANGFYELQDAKEQRLRFEKNLSLRAELNLPSLPIDEFLLSALEHGLPDCAGVALGIDRLIMLATGSNAISDVISFDFSRA